ncbi:ATP-dependent zinc metalloprotease FtsH [Aminiphilus circumscriptus]|uniref:ATP-dependent zinc metalloprotease FtsH n=1 Tax=Aminiphilus circumscriptus TaxID=290732 RepID=UPI0004925D12|nr:ATP-dependent zinc metalloprotease FtsH [Aminiphilus circumscriptus]
MDPKRKQKQMKFSMGYMLIALLVVWLFNDLIFRPLFISETEVTYSDFLRDLEAGKVEHVSIGGDRILFNLRNESTGKTGLRNAVRVDDPQIVERLLKAKVPFEAQSQAKGLVEALLGWVLPFLPLLVIWYFFYKRMSEGGAGVMSIGKSKAQEIHGELTGIKFSNVGGVGEAEVELREIIDYLKEPSRFNRLGAKLPKGVLLVGPPGTGKTLLAKATAGEAGVPFFFLTGSSFVEMFVGVGAARVRDLFEQAKRKAPCIIFIDEIDAIGQARSSVAAVGGNSERENTLNQLLAEMDGFAPNTGVVIMAATNRPEILDQALLRPGRFDRQVQVVLPSESGRLEILRIHTREMPLDQDVSLERLAKVTPGFSGADLANIANEASLLAVRRKGESVTMADFDLAIERVVAGLQRKTPLSGEVRRKVAYHEAGHALAAHYLPHTDPVHKVSIIPTAKGALGYTMQMPEEDRYLIGEEELRSRMAVMLGGRAAELLVFGEATTGAANDLERVTEVARRMVTEFGMSSRLGPVRYAAPAGMYLQGMAGGRSDLSPETIACIDEEIRQLVKESQERSLDILRKHETALHEVSRILQEEEIISGERIRWIAEECDRNGVSVPGGKNGNDVGGTA